MRENIMKNNCNKERKIFVLRERINIRKEEILAVQEKNNKNNRKKEENFAVQEK